MDAGQIAEARARVEALIASAIAAHEPRAEAGLAPDRASSAANLLHYLSLRSHDIRDLQDRLQGLGLSSLGRAEPATLHALLAVAGVLGALSGVAPRSDPPSAITPERARATLEKRTVELLGPPAPGRRTRIMVTAPAEAARDPSMIAGLLSAGMSVLRINAAHDTPGEWLAMIESLREARRELRLPCKLLIDLPGPKLRTGRIAPGPRVLRARPVRDALGRVVSPARVRLASDDRSAAQGPPVLPVGPEILRAAAPGDVLTLTDSRGARRRWTVEEADGQAAIAVCARTTYFTTGAAITLRGKAGLVRSRVGALPESEQEIRLAPGDTLLLTRDQAPGVPASIGPDGRTLRPARVPCTLPRVFADVRPGHRVGLDDGRLFCLVRHASADRLELLVTHARPQGERLGSDKGINLPDSDPGLPYPGPEDREALAFAAAHADLIGLSFLRTPADLGALRRELASIADPARPAPGLLLKIETRRAFENLPKLLLAALEHDSAGVMIARGDLAVEMGYERLAEVQEEVLWLSEAAHLPVVWATQVLEGLAKTGRASRAEITDAAMSERAECVMLNKGPYILQAVRSLDNILRRMQEHQQKKRSMLRPLSIARGFRPGGG